MRKLLWAAAGLLCVAAGAVAFDRAAARQVPPPALDPPAAEAVKAVTGPPIGDGGLLPPPAFEAPSLPPPSGLEPFAEPAIAPGPSNAGGPSPDPVEQVGELSQRIQARRAEDLAAVQDLVGRLAAQADAQRAALARTEEALRSARALEAEASGQPAPGDEASLEQLEPASERVHY